MIFASFQTCRNFVSCGRPGTSRHSNVSHKESEGLFVWQSLLNTKGLTVNCQADLKFADVRFDPGSLEYLFK